MKTKKKPEETEETIDETEEKGSAKGNKKFVGGYLDFEAVALLKEDAKRDRRTLSMQLEYLVLMAMRMRGHDVSKISDIPTHNREFQDIEDYLKWKDARR